ncbi:PfkB family carbohydrate kinase [Nocardia sp. NPDC051052]|uniref:PfkB family carbohydrate kinase n=1 Tax=Nocardia sp. NPDC051052 TaxID=3364322 RepID=UPI003787A59B
MRIVVTGSIANGAGNISYGLARLGAAPILVSTARPDFAEQQRRLARSGVNTQRTGTANPVPILMKFDDVRWVVVAPDDPEVMLARTHHILAGGYPLVACPSPRLSDLERDEARALVAGADLLFTDENERELLSVRTGWTTATVLSKVRHWITTFGPDGALVEFGGGAPAQRVAAVPSDTIVGGTGAGDGFRAGYLAGLRYGADPVNAAYLGATVAALVLESPAPQGYQLDLATMLARIRSTYGPTTARHIGRLLTSTRGKSATSATMRTARVDHDVRLLPRNRARTQPGP